MAVDTCWRIGPMAIALGTTLLMPMSLNAATDQQTTAVDDGRAFWLWYAEFGGDEQDDVFDPLDYAAIDALNNTSSGTAAEEPVLTQPINEPKPVDTDRELSQ